MVVLIPLIAVTSFFYEVREGQLTKESGAATEPTATAEQIKLENASERDIAHNPVRGVQHVVARKLGTTPTATTEQIKLENASERDIVHNPGGGVQHVVAGKLGTTPTATSEQIKLENASERDIVHNPVGGVQHVVAGKLGTAQTTNAAKENDPVELWKAVKRGSVKAEVALANLYLEGEAVPQNCDQAHMLLYAASMKGSKAADSFLKSSYAERCR